MGIDTLIGEGDIGVKVTDLVVPKEKRRKPSLFFDPERDISFDDWNKLRGYAVSLKKDPGSVPDLWHFLSYMSVYPKAREYLDPDGAILKIFQIHERLSGVYPTGWEQSFDLALLKLSYPNETHPFIPSLYESLLSQRETFLGGTTLSNFLECAFAFRVLFPEKGDEFPFTVGDFEIIQENCHKNNTVLSFSFHDFALLSVLCPELKPKYFSEDMVKGEIRDIRETITTQWNISRNNTQFFDVTVLTAEDAWINNIGQLVLGPKEKTAFDSTPMLPKTRRF